MEEWKDIVGYEGLYQVSNMGQVKSLWFNKTKILKPYVTSDGYLQVSLYNGGKGNSYLIHRLVGQAFIDNPNNKPHINHKNEFEKTNNSAYNLEWCDILYNNNYGTRNKRISTSHSIKVIGINIINGIILEFKSSVEAKTIGFDDSCIRKCCNNKRVSHKGYIWRCYI